MQISMNFIKEGKCNTERQGRTGIKKYAFKKLAMFQETEKYIVIYKGKYVRRETSAVVAV